MGKWFCDNPKVVEYIYTKGIKGIKSVYKTHKENGNLEKVTVPELKKIANVVFMDILKTNKKFIAKLKRRGKTTENPTDTGTIFKKPIHFDSKKTCRYNFHLLISNLYIKNLLTLKFPCKSKLCKLN